MTGAICSSTRASSAGDRAGHARRGRAGHPKDFRTRRWTVTPGSNRWHLPRVQIRGRQPRGAEALPRDTGGRVRRLCRRDRITRQRAAELVTPWPPPGQGWRRVAWFCVSSRLCRQRRDFSCRRKAGRIRGRRFADRAGSQARRLAPQFDHSVSSGLGAWRRIVRLRCRCRSLLPSLSRQMVPSVTARPAIRSVMHVHATGRQRRTAGRRDDRAPL
jgi:hypothetical protein